ncbi:MAG: MFS transporter [Chloroflexi bacterium]|nr:MFS transporter [Chloroflexota bacterium]
MTQRHPEDPSLPTVAIAPRPGWTRTLLDVPAFRYRDFRFLWLSTFLTSVASTSEQLALSWYALTESDTPFMVGVALGLRMAPFFLFGLPAGVLADRVDRRHAMRLLIVGMAAISVVIGVIILRDMGKLELWLVLVPTFVAGSLRAVYQTMKHSAVYDIVGHAHASNGLAINSIATRIGAVVGSLSAGSLVARASVPTVYMVVAGIYLLGALAVMLIRSRGQAAPTARTSVRQGLREYVREVRHNRGLRLLFLYTSVAEVLGFSHQVLLPSLARDVLKVGAEGLGLMNAVRALGGILGTAILTSLGTVRRQGVLFLVSLHLFGGSIILLSVVPNLPVALALLALVNAMGSITDVLLQSLMQLSVPNELRGRAMGSYLLAIGTSPLGQLQLGALASVTTVALAFTINGAALVALAALGTVLFPTLRRL